MMKYTPRVRSDSAPTINPSSADTAMATGHCAKPDATPS